MISQKLSLAHLGPLLQNSARAPEGYIHTFNRSRMGAISENFGLLLGSAFQQIWMILERWLLKSFGMPGLAAPLAI